MAKGNGDRRTETGDGKIKTGDRRTEAGDGKPETGKIGNGKREDGGWE